MESKVNLEMPLRDQLEKFFKCNFSPEEPRNYFSFNETYQSSPEQSLLLSRRMLGVSKVEERAASRRSSSSSENVVLLLKFFKLTRSLLNSSVIYFNFLGEQTRLIDLVCPCLWRARIRELDKSVEVELDKI